VAGQKDVGDLNVWRRTCGVHNLRKRFRKIYAEYIRHGKAAERASRCSQCGVPYCQTSCHCTTTFPIGYSSRRSVEEAYEMAQATNTFPDLAVFARRIAFVKNGA
jgi:glutamate synthase (NADPH/NADH) small chain